VLYELLNQSFHIGNVVVWPKLDWHLTVGNGVGGLWKDERVAEKQTTISAAAGGPLAALVAQDTAGQTAP
jgi:hypothetical protein